MGTQCEATTLAWKRCTRAATHVVGTRYWGDTRASTEYAYRRRTWVQFNGVCAQHRNSPLIYTDGQYPGAFGGWGEHVGATGCANGRRLGYVRIPQDAHNVLTTLTQHDKLIPQNVFDIKAAGRAGQYT